MKYVGIDPGKTGAWAVIEANATGHWVDSYGLVPIINNGYDVRGMGEVAKEIGNASFWIEETQAFSAGRTSPKATSSLARCCGIWEGILGILEQPYHLVRPIEWQRAQMRTWDKGKTKERAVAVVRQRFPDVDLRLKKSWGIADAVLIALHGMHQSIPEQRNQTA